MIILSQEQMSILEELPIYESVGCKSRHKSYSSDPETDHLVERKNNCQIISSQLQQFGIGSLGLQYICLLPDTLAVEETVRLTSAGNSEDRSDNSPDKDSETCLVDTPEKTFGQQVKRSLSQCLIRGYLKLSTDGGSSWRNLLFVLRDNTMLLTYKNPEVNIRIPK